jgi:hypothetical protein
MAIWLVVKIVYVEAVIPRRNLHRQPRETGENLAALVPENAILYLFNLKDEGVMFYYGRKVVRLARPDDLPVEDKPFYCILDDAEFQQWQSRPEAELVKRLHDQQGDPIALVRLRSFIGQPVRSNGRLGKRLPSHEGLDAVAAQE